MIKAIFETPNFNFESYGNSKKEAKELLKKAWKKHSEQTGADPDYIKDYEEDISFTTVKVGCTYRDNDKI